MAGSIRQRGQSSWELRVHAGRDEHSGQYRYVTKTVRGTRREAERELARLVANVDDGVATSTPGTVRELCDKWFEHASPGLSPVVAAEYRRLLDRRILPKWGTTPLRRLRTADLDAWYSQLRRTGSATGGPLAPNSVTRVHAILRRALNQGLKWGWLTVNPAVSASPPRVKKFPIEIPSTSQIAMLLAAAEAVNPALPVFLRLAAATGARRGELCALRWCHLDLQAGQMHVEGALVQVGREVIAKDTKTHAERRLSLDTGTADLLAAYRRAGAQALLAVGVAVSDDMFVFSHAPQHDVPWQPNYVTRAFGRLTRELDLDGLRLHDLRHFAATTMLINGIDVRTAAGRLGHAQTSTTLDTYAHFIQAADQRAAAAIGDVLDAPASGARTRSSTRRASRHA